MKSVLIIGAGPAGLYAAEKLSDEGIQVSIINRDVKPGGLAEFGIYPNKFKMKGTLRNYFADLLSRDNVFYHGHVAIGEQRELHFEDLQKLGFDAIIVAVGAQGTKSLGLEGEDGPGVYHAKEVVYHYNGLPPFAEREFPVGQNTTIIGIGNVCLDLVHWLVCEKKIESVTSVARRGPGEVKFTKKEVRIVSAAMDQQQIHEEIQRVSECVKAVGQNPEAEEKSILKFVDYPLETESPTKFRMRFLVSPSKIVRDENGNVTGLLCKKNRLVPGEKRIGVEHTGEEEVIPCDTVIFAIGDQIDANFGLPLNPDWSGAYATVKEPWAENPDRDRYMVDNPAEGHPMWGVFVVGWARNASDGLVGRARLDAVSGCDEVLAYLNNKFEGQPEVKDHDNDPETALVELLNSHHLVWDNWEEAKRLEAYESRVAEEQGLGVYRLGNDDKMLHVCKTGKE